MKKIKFLNCWNKGPLEHRVLADPFPDLVVLNQLVAALQEGKHVEVLRLPNEFQELVNYVVVP